MDESFSDLFTAADTKAKKEQRQAFLNKKSGRGPGDLKRSSYVTPKVRKNRRKKGRAAKIARRKNR